MFRICNLQRGKNLFRRFIIEIIGLADALRCQFSKVLVKKNLRGNLIGKKDDTHKQHQVKQLFGDGCVDFFCNPRRCFLV